jgi:hypothetical protein
MRNNKPAPTPALSHGFGGDTVVILSSDCRHSFQAPLSTPTRLIVSALRQWEQAIVVMMAFAMFFEARDVEARKPSFCGGLYRLRYSAMQSIEVENINLLCYRYG